MYKYNITQVTRARIMCVPARRRAYRGVSNIIAYPQYYIELLLYRVFADVGFKNLYFFFFFKSYEAQKVTKRPGDSFFSSFQPIGIAVFRVSSLWCRESSESKI